MKPQFYNILRRIVCQNPSPILLQISFNIWLSPKVFLRLVCRVFNGSLIGMDETRTRTGPKRVVQELLRELLHLRTLNYTLFLIYLEIGRRS